MKRNKSIIIETAERQSAVRQVFACLRIIRRGTCINVFTAWRSAAPLPQ
jgi:hypothetical protein